MASKGKRRILIRGLEAGAAYLAYLLAKSGDRVVIETKRPHDVYIYDLSPPRPLFTLKFLNDVLLADIVDSADADKFEIVVDSCDIDEHSVLKLYEGTGSVYIRGDPWLSATVSLWRGAPAPSAVDLPLEKTEKYEEVDLEVERYHGASYTLCEAVDYPSGEKYVVKRSLERVYIAADIFVELKLGLRRPPNLKLEYAVGKEEVLAAFGAKAVGKSSRVSHGGVSISTYGEGGEIKFVTVRAPVHDLDKVLLLYNGMRLNRHFYLYDVSTSRGLLNISALGHLTRHLRQS